MNNLETQRIVKSVLESGHLMAEDTSYIVYDLDAVKKRYEELKSAFPENTLHGIAIKSCPLPFILKYQAYHGLGAEAASIEEVKIAMGSGIPCDNIIFDGPAKTKEEIEFCIANKIYINMDSFEEVDRVASLLNGRDFKAGIRLNPQIGTGKIGDTSVAGKKSKFGVALDDYKDKITSTFKKYSWLVGCHVHIGSQGMSLEDLVNGTSKVFNAVKDFDGLTYFDVGGGLPVVYHEDDIPVDIKTYTDELKKVIPELFSGKLRLLTEFGRKIYADMAIAVSNIEYVKEDKQIVNHLGADMFLRRVYKPDQWFHKISALSNKGDKLNTSSQSYSVAGPLCFGGDFLARELNLPKVQERDLLIVHDVGAYTLSMWSRHCSRFTPKVLGLKNGKILQIKKRETIEQLMSFWS